MIIKAWYFFRPQVELKPFYIGREFLFLITACQIRDRSRHIDFWGVNKRISIGWTKQVDRVLWPHKINPIMRFILVLGYQRIRVLTRHKKFVVNRTGQ